VPARRPAGTAPSPARPGSLCCSRRSHGWPSVSRRAVMRRV